MIFIHELKESLDILLFAKNNLNYDDYVAIWGERLGKHIWYQEKEDLIRILGSGLSQEEKDKFINYVLKIKEIKKSKNE